MKSSPGSLASSETEFKVRLELRGDGVLEKSAVVIFFLYNRENCFVYLFRPPGGLAIFFRSFFTGFLPPEVGLLLFVVVLMTPCLGLYFGLFSLFVQ